MWQTLLLPTLVFQSLSRAAGMRVVTSWGHYCAQSWRFLDGKAEREVGCDLTRGHTGESGRAGAGP